MADESRTTMRKPEHDLFEAAWGLIANAHEGDWSSAPVEWREAAERWRDRFHEIVVPQWAPGGRIPPEPPSVDELQALLPWAAMETNSDGELVIYTGIRLRDPETGEEGPFWIEGMPDV